MTAHRHPAPPVPAGRWQRLCVVCAFFPGCIPEKCSHSRCRGSSFEIGNQLPHLLGAPNRHAVDPVNTMRIQHPALRSGPPQSSKDSHLFFPPTNRQLFASFEKDAASSRKLWTFGPAGKLTGAQCGVRDRVNLHRFSTLGWRPAWASPPADTTPRKCRAEQNSTVCFSSGAQLAQIEV